MENKISKEIFVGKIRKYLNNFEIFSGDGKFGDETLGKFYTLYAELLEWNKKINITRITDENEFIKKHIVDSAFLLKILDENSKSVMDIGSGAGFPGIILNIFNPSLNIISVESIFKKCNFQKSVTRKLNLYNFCCLNLNAFLYNDFNNIDAITTRAAFNVKELTRFIESINLTKSANLYLFLSKISEAEEIKNFGYTTKKVSIDKILFYKTDYDADNNSGSRLIAKFRTSPVFSP